MKILKVRREDSSQLQDYYRKKVEKHCD